MRLDSKMSGMKTPRVPAAIVLAALTLSVAAVSAPAAPVPPAGWTLIGKAGLDVTQGTITTAGRHATLRTRDPGMRATVRDGGRHATWGRLWFRYLGESTTTVPLGSGLIRRQVGLKLRSADPCNLLYVMWHQFPEEAIEVQIKRNPGQTTSSQCGNRGYTTLAKITLGADSTGDHTAHLLEVRTRRLATGGLGVSVFTDGTLLRRLGIPAALSAGVDGPIGVRSDNGHYLFQLSGRR